MRRDLISEEERLKALECLRTCLAQSIEHETEEPFLSKDIMKYEGDLEPILVAVIEAFRQGGKAFLDLMNPAEKLELFKRQNQ